MKKILFYTVCMMLAAAMLAGCGAKAAPAEKEEAPVKAEVPLAGGWTVNEEDTGMAANPDAQAALEKALEGMVGASYEPVACLGTQVVAGTNYCILCRITPVVPKPTSHFALVYVYRALDGTAKILDVQDLALGVQAAA